MAAYKIKVTLLRTDGWWFSYGIALRDHAEDYVPLAHTDVTFEAPGLDNLTVEGDYNSVDEIVHDEIADAAEQLVAEFEKVPDDYVGDAGTGHGDREFRSGN